MTVSKERYDLNREAEEVVPYKEDIFLCCSKLGMIQTWDNKLEPDYILPLGGAKESNIKRVEFAKKVFDRYKNKNIKIVALSSNRMLDEKEIPAVKSFAEKASTEFEAINGGMESVFNLNNQYDIKNVNADKPEDSWKIVSWESDQQQKCYSICTPFINGRRANTRDTFKHFIKEFNVEKGSVISLVSNALYGPYQFISLLKIAIDNGLILQFEGRPIRIKEGSIATYYLSEVKGAINAMYEFVNSTIIE